MILWPLVFITFRSVFVYAMACATFVLALFSLLKQKRLIVWKKRSLASAIFAGVAGAVLLYLLFLAGYYLSQSLGLEGYVSQIYTMIYSQASLPLIVVLLALIAVFEEMYWRGGLQGYAAKHSRVFRSKPWIAAVLYYSVVHLATLNPILALAAFFVGLVTSLVADRYGIIASIIAHILWIEAIIVFLPVIAL